MANARERSESIYTALPVLGPIPSLYDPGTTATATRRSDAAATSSLDILNRVHQLGPVDHVLTRTLSERRELESARRRNRERLDRVRRDDDGELDAEGDADYTDSVVNTRKRGWSSATAAEGGDDEKTELSITRAGTRRTRSSRQRKKPNPLDPSSASDSLFGPRLSLSTPSIDLPCTAFDSRQIFLLQQVHTLPRISLLSSVHLHASQVLTSQFHLVPPLTTETPLLPPDILTKFNETATELNQLELAILSQPGLKQRQVDEVRRHRLSKIGTGARKHVWANLEKKFDSSSLVALANKVVF
ncbi:hypothetical protein JCM3766R1_001180 [Sporobolomyces carnicolor]